MRAGDWSRALAEGRVQHRWMDLRLSSPGHEALVRVSADAMMVDGVRQSAGAFAVQRVADEMGALMLTAKLYEARHLACSARIDPCLSSFIKRGGTTSNMTALEHHTLLERRLASELDRSSVANCGKLFILDSKCTLTRAVNHGWMVPRSACSFGQGGKLFWKGVPVYAPAWAPSKEWAIVQLRGAAHGFGETGSDQDDYSQVILLVAGECVLDGVSERTARLYTDPSLAALVTHDGKPLAWTRHPGVPMKKEKDLAGEKKKDDAMQGTAPRPSVLHQRDPKGSSDGPVKTWQRWLMANGYPLPKFGADGDHGSETETMTLKWRADGSLTTKKNS